MAAKPLHAVRPTEFAGDKLADGRLADPRLSEPRLSEHAPVVTLDRRKMSMSERFAEGRGYWRGVVSGGLLGLLLGCCASLGLMNVWVPQIMNVAQQAWVASLVVAGKSPNATEPSFHSSPSAPDSAPGK
jgi:hypothetical protein